MTDVTTDQQRAADCARGAALRLVQDWHFDLARFLQAEVDRTERGKRLSFVGNTLSAALHQHAGLLITLDGLGLLDERGDVRQSGVFDAVEVLRRAVELAESTATHPATSHRTGDKP